MFDCPPNVCSCNRYLDKKTKKMESNFFPEWSVKNGYNDMVTYKAGQPPKPKSF